MVWLFTGCILCYYVQDEFFFPIPLFFSSDFILVSLLQLWCSFSCLEQFKSYHCGFFVQLTKSHRQGHMVKVDWLDRLTFREIEMINEVSHCTSGLEFWGFLLCFSCLGDLALNCLF